MITRIELWWARHLIRTSRRYRIKAMRLNKRSSECLKMADKHYKRLGIYQ